MKRFVPLILTITAIISCSENTNKKKEYYPNGIVRTELTVKDGKKNGPAKWYYETGKLKREGTYFNDSLEGTSRYYYENGKIESERMYSHGKISGVDKEYYENGKLNIVTNYKNSIQGLTKEYHESGTLKSVVNFINNIRDYYFYYENGKIQEHAIMENEITIYYLKYDSLGNKGKEYREVRCEVASSNIKLGETFMAKLKLTGPSDSQLIDAMSSEEEKIVGIESLTNLLPLNGKNEGTYSFKPKKKGKYKYRIWFLVRDPSGYHPHDYWHEGNFTCN